MTNVPRKPVPIPDTCLLSFFIEITVAKPIRPEKPRQAPVTILSEPEAELQRSDDLPLALPLEFLAQPRHAVEHRAAALPLPVDPATHPRARLLGPQAAARWQKLAVRDMGDIGPED